ncbi:methyltransferase domain-containing protein [candidate division WWE3 bacterium]|uniref:Methyltransferase domain-containing protein n=1 Tax=candidate division WWE3 bacterium TaxID=2053526 RepID=A0A955RS54_UNCKA|nr:methyltransferase domain-containing protein [candidate division WWE3 bacterium]
MDKKEIIDYYTQAEIDYKLYWHLGESMALHYGYWDETTKRLRDALRRENEVLAEKVAIKEGDTVLDAGCGVGGSSIFLAQRYGCKVTGISITPVQIEEAVKNAMRFNVSDKVRFEVQDFTKTTFPDESFNVVWAIESVCHAHDKRDFLDEAYRVLKPGGRLIVADWFVSSIKDNDNLTVKRWIKGWAVESLETIGGFGGLARDAGFQNVETEDVTEHVIRSSKRLYQGFSPAMFITRLQELIGMGNKFQRANRESTKYQYLAIQNDLAQYGFISGRK